MLSVSLHSPLMDYCLHGLYLGRFGSGGQSCSDRQLLAWWLLLDGSTLEDSFVSLL